MQLVPSALSPDHHQQFNTTCLGWQAQEAVSSVRPQRAQARGRALLNLRLRDAEGGLLGRTLLTFILNKVWQTPLHAFCLDPVCSQKFSIDVCMSCLATADADVYNSSAPRLHNSCV